MGFQADADYPGPGPDKVGRAEGADAWHAEGVAEFKNMLQAKVMSPYDMPELAEWLGENLTNYETAELVHAIVHGNVAEIKRITDALIEVAADGYANVRGA